jgi:hypothetical protein
MFREVCLGSQPKHGLYESQSSYLLESRQGWARGAVALLIELPKTMGYMLDLILVMHVTAAE